jgi:hypothetical protein
MEFIFMGPKNGARPLAPAGGPGEMTFFFPAMQQSTAAQNHPGAAAFAPAPKTFCARFCEDHHCAPADFGPALLRVCLQRRAAAIFALAGGAEFFAADRELVEMVAHATAMDDVRDAIDAYWDHPANRRWLRRMAGGRVATLRLRRIAREYLPLENPPRPRPSRWPVR